MFNRPGHKLKIIAIVIFFFFTILGVVIGLLAAAGNALEAAEQSQAATLLFGSWRPASTLFVIVCGLIGMVVGWINSIFLYAAGSLVDDVEMIKNSVAQSTPTAGKPTWMR